MKKPYTLFKRSNGVYYVRFRDIDGERLSAITTGATRKAEAESFAINSLRNGKVDALRSDSFGKFTEDFFDYEKSTFIRNELRCGRSYGKRTAEENARILKNFLLPLWKEKSLAKIKVKEIDELLFSLSERYSSSRVCATRNVIACIFNEAHRIGVIDENPMERVSKITAKAVEKGIYDQAVIAALFDPKSLDSVWSGKRFHYVLNYTAYITGMRQGELLGLRPDHVFPDHVRVEYSWERGHGLKDPKYKSFRAVPLTKSAYELLQGFIAERKLKPDELIFSGDTPTLPIDHRAINRRLTEALERIGITDEDRKAKNLTFHSWRHVFVSMWRGKISNDELQLLTGHKSVKMVEHYSHFNMDAIRSVQSMQEDLFTIAA